MSANAETWGAPPAEWTRSHLLGLETLSREEIILLLDTAERFRREILEDPRGTGRKIPLLTGQQRSMNQNLFCSKYTRQAVYCRRTHNYKSKQFLKEEIKSWQ